MRDNSMKARIRKWIVFCIAIGLTGGLLAGCGRDKEDRSLQDTEQEAELYDWPDEEQAAEPEEKVQEEQPETGSEQENRSAGKKDGTWTVMVYMCGTDLESMGACASENLLEMMFAEKTDQVNVLVQTGGCSQWYINEDADQMEQFPGIKTDVLGRYRVVNEDIILEDTETLASMGDPETLKEFILWGSESFPADKYMLIFWDHGGGSMGGVCADELYEGETLSLKDIKEAVSEADIPLEAVGFDACLMATLETAESIQGYAHYMIASEETEPGGGWDYEDFLSYLCESPGMGGDELGQRIADGFMAKCAYSDEEDTCTLSVTDLTRIPALSAAYRALSGEFLLSTTDSESFTAVYQGAARAVNYGGNTEAEGFTNMVDLGDLVDQTGDLLNLNAAAVEGALHDAVKYEIHGDNRKGSHGLSVFYPLGLDEDTVGTYAQITDNTTFLEYTNILIGDFDSAEWEEKWEKAWEEAYGETKPEEGKYDSLFNEGQTPITEYVPQEEPEEFYEALSDLDPINEQDYKVEFTERINDNGYHQLKITSGLDVVSEVSFELYYEVPETGEFMYLGSDNDLNANWDTGVFTDNFEGSWITIGDEFVYAELIEQNEEYSLYSVPALVNGKEKHLKAVYDYEKGKFRILGMRDGIDESTGQCGRDEKLRDGDRIEFLFYVYDPESDNEEMVTAGEIEWRNNTKMEDTYMDDDRFLYIFRVKDVFGNVYYGDPVYMEIIDGEISVYEP
ncbi:MAG: hypothetical protein K6G83_02810 [Lachnospiraceae bacterium]|nr:hypothetical protein [Lachnospiraceae bacterium]